MKRKVTIRPLDDSLEDQLSRLLTLVYPLIPEARDSEFYKSSYRWLEQHPLADQLHRWAAVTDEDEVVGFLMATPQCYRVHGRRVVAHTPGHYMVLPQHGFQAFSLMRTFFRTCENCVSCDMVPAVMEIQNRFGTEEAGTLNYAIKLLNVSRLPAPPMPARLRRLLNVREPAIPAQGYPDPRTREEVREDTPELIEGEAPSPVRPRLPLPGPAKRLLNGGLRVVDEALGMAFGRGPKVEVLPEFDESFDELFEAVAGAVPCVPEKDSAFLRWRYGPGSPPHPVTILGVREGGRLLGYAVLKTTIGQDGALLDLMTRPGHREVARPLLREAIRFFRREGAFVIRYRYLDSPAAPLPGDVQKQGFFYRKIRHHTLMTKFSDPGLHKTTADGDNWAYNIGDSESAFWTR